MPQLFNLARKHDWRKGLSAATELAAMVFHHQHSTFSVLISLGRAKSPDGKQGIPLVNTQAARAEKMQLPILFPLFPLHYTQLLRNVISA
jgi:hypothetical protein